MVDLISGDTNNKAIKKTASALNADNRNLNLSGRFCGCRYINQAYSRPSNRQGKTHQPDTAPHVIENSSIFKIDVVRDTLYVIPAKCKIIVNVDVIMLVWSENKEAHP